ECAHAPMDAVDGGRAAVNQACVSHCVGQLYEWWRRLCMVQRPAVAQTGDSAAPPERAGGHDQKAIRRSTTMTRSMRMRFATSLLIFASLCGTQAMSAQAAGLHQPPGAGSITLAARRLLPAAPGIPLAARTANGVPGSGLHSLGFVPNRAAPRPTLISASVARPASLPASVDLSQYAPPVG